MNLVSFINRLILKKVFEVLFVLFLIFLSLILIFRQSFQTIFQDISYFKETNYTHIYIENNSLPYRVHVINETYTKETFQLMLRIPSCSESINLKINGLFVSLNDLDQKDENTFLVLKDEIVADEKKYVIDFLDTPVSDAEFYLENILRI